MRTTAAATAAVLAMIHTTIGALADVFPPPPMATLSSDTGSGHAAAPVPSPNNAPVARQQENTPQEVIPLPSAPAPQEVAARESSPTEPLVKPAVDTPPQVNPNAPEAPAADAGVTAAQNSPSANTPKAQEQTGAAVSPPQLLKGNSATLTSIADPPAKSIADSPTANSNGNSATKSNPKTSLRDDDTAGSEYLDPSLSNACVCKDVRKVSLMSASDYCLSPAAVIGNKCGNAAVAEKGECPRAGAQPCQDTGHVLANDSMCAYDSRDETYKCVASTEDLYIQKNGKRKKPTNTTTKPPTGGGSSGAATLGGVSALQVVLLVASLAVGLAAVA